MSLQYPKESDLVLTSLRIRSENIQDPAIDLSEHVDYGRSVLKLRTKCQGNDNTVTFGTNDHPWEYNWEFADKEDFCWTHTGTGKQLSVSKDGVAVKNLTIADFALNNEVEGRRYYNEIDVKTVLQNLVTAQAVLSQQIAEIDPGNTSDLISQLNTSVGQLRLDLDNRHRFHYGDTAPAISNNGDAWFNSTDLHLYIKHINAWVRPDRVEDPALDAAVTELKAEVESLKQSNTNEVSAIESSLSSLQAQVNSAVVSVASNRIHYGENPPANATDGDIWFDTNALVLYVRHSDLWLSPDRNETTAMEQLKASLLSAVNASTSFFDLKARLMTALAAS